MAEAVTPLFRKYVDGFTIGELPKTSTPEVNTKSFRTPGYVQLDDGSWAPQTECVRLPRGGRFVWVRLS
jgi:hypothetical protein